MTWTARNTGLSGTALNVNYITQHPATRHLNSTSHELLIATDDGVYHSIDGGRSWAKIIMPDPSNDELQLQAAKLIEDLTFHWVDYDPLDALTFFALGAAATGSVNHLWIYKTTDSGLNWISRGITTL